MVIKRLRKFNFLIPFFIALILYFVLPLFPRVTEKVFTRGLFRVISAVIGSLISLLPFSVTEILAVLIIPAFIVLLIWFIRKMLRSENRRATAVKVIRRIGWILSITLLLYMLTHGVNFYRQPAEQLLDIDTSEFSPEQLLEICIDLAQKASLEREELAEDENGCMILSQSVGDTLRKAGDGYHILQKEYPFLRGSVWRAKPVRLSRPWSYTGITGMYFPMLVEANVNIDQPDFDIPATAAHELAHTRGFAKEDDCNFFAYLTCINNESGDFRYSGYLFAYMHFANALYDYNKDLWREAKSHCSEKMLRDLKAHSAYWKKFEGKVEQAAAGINNAFLQSQGVQEGVFNYGRVVELIAGYYLK